MDNKLKKVNSSHLRAASYDEDTNVLTVIFQGGASYEYEKVSESLYERLISVSNAGSKIFFPYIQPNHRYRRSGSMAWHSPKG